MRKYVRLFTLALFTFLLSSMSVSAREMTIEELGEEASKIQSDAGYVYILGEYAFTSNYNISQADIIIASSSLNIENPTDLSQAVIYQIVRQRDENYQPTGWQAGTNVLGNKALPEKVNVKWIDMKHRVLEKSESEISMDIDSDDNSAYKTGLKTHLNFDTETFYGKNDDKITITGNKVKGLLLKKSVDDIHFNEADKKKYAKAEYFLAVIVKVPGADENTTITVKNLKGETTSASWNDFDVTSGTPGMFVLFSFNKQDWEDSNKQIVITVDLDGQVAEGDEYAPTDYSIDLSELRFQEESKMDFTSNDLPQTDIEYISNHWGYTKSDADTYQLEAGEGTNKYKLTGIIVQQKIGENVFPDEEETGYYFLFNVGQNINPGLYSKATVTYPGNGATKTSTITDATGVTILFSTSDDKKNNSITIKVDLDGNGDEYLPVEYEIDLSGLTLEKTSKFSVQGVDEVDEAVSKLGTDFGWKKETGFETSFVTEGSNVKVIGLLPILESFTGEHHPFGDEDETGYYLPFVIKTDSGNKTENSGVTVQFIHEGEEIRTFTADNFDGNDVLYILRHLDKDATDKTFKIVVDMDGDGKEYAPYTLTFDWSDLKLQEKSTVNVTDNLNSESETEFSEWGYQKDKNSNINFEKQENENITKVSGKLVEQKLTTEPFGVGKEEGYYFTFAFTKPENVKSMDNAKIYRLNNKPTEDGTLPGSDIKKTFSKEDFDSDGSLTILYRFDPTTTKCSTDDNADNCKLYYVVDYDGEGHEYLPTLYVIDYSGLTFEKASLFTVVEINNSNKTQYEDNGWYNETDGYSVKVQKDDQVPNKYKVSGVLPILENSDWKENNPPFESGGSLLYYLGLGLKLENAPKNYNNQHEKITILFDHDAESQKFKNIFGEDFDESQTIYILKALKTSDQSGALLKADEKWFKITVDLDGENEEYAPYEVTIDYSDLEFQDNSLGDIDFDVFSNESSVGDSSAEKTELEGYSFDFDTVKDVKIKTENNGGDDREPSKTGLQGKIKEQTLAKGFDTNNGYFVPIKISVPQDEEWFKKHQNDWTITLYTEKGDKKTYKPTSQEHTQGWVMVLFRLDDEKADKVLKYEIDFDGEGKAFLPTEYTIKYSDLNFQTENKITFEYFDEKTGKIEKTEKIVYQGDPISSSLAPQFDDKNYSYHEFDYWYDTKEGASNHFDFETETTGKDEDITLKAHWTIDVDTFLADVVKDLASVESEITSDYSDIFEVSKTENTITFKVLDSATKLSELSDTSIPGAIAYILQRGEVKDITLASGGKKVVFTKEGYNDGIQSISLDETGTALKEQVKAGAKALFVDVLGSDVNEQNMTLNQMAVLDKNFTLTIGTLDDSVKLPDGAETTYTFDFETEVAPVKTEQELKDALANPKITHIDIADSFSVNNTIDINRKIVIGASEKKTITANEETDTIFNIKTSDVTIDTIDLNAKTPITISETGQLTSTGIGITGDKTEAGIVVENGGIFTGSEITYTGEKYSKPLVKAKNSTNGVNLTNTKGEKASPITMQQVERYVPESDGAYKNSIGDKLVVKEGYQYKNYYNNPDVEHNFIKITYSGDRVTTSYPISFIRWFDKEEESIIEPPDNVQYLTSYSDSFANYTIEAWVQGGSTRYEKDHVPIPSEDTYYGADLKATYKQGVITVSDEQNLIKEVSSEGENHIIIVKDKITLSNELDIQKSGITIMGVEEKGNKNYATIEGKIKVNADNVHFEKINIVGKSSTTDENQSVITVSNTGFSTYQANVSAGALTEEKNWHSLIQFTHNNPKTVIYFGNFEGSNSKMMIDFKQAIGNDSIIVGNNFNGANETEEFINIAAIDNGAEIDIRQQTATFIGTNEYGIRIKAPADSTTATINLGSFWANSLNKVLKIGIDVTQENHDASGFTFKAGEVFRDRIQIVYIKNGESAELTNPFGDQFNATLEIVPNPLLH